METHAMEKVNFMQTSGVNKPSVLGTLLRASFTISWTDFPSVDN